MIFQAKKCAQLFAIILLVAFVSSCKSKKMLGNSEFKKKSQSELLSDVQERELDFKNASGKISLHLVLPGGPKNTKKVGGVVKIVKDEVMQISLRPMLGIEVFRMTITPDSIYFIDRYNKKTAVEGIAALQKSVNFNYYNLQALLTNAIFVPGKKEMTKSDYSKFKVDMTPDAYLASLKGKELQYSFAIDANDRIISTLIYRQEENQAVQWSYDKFIIDKEYIYPTSMQAQIEFDNKRFNLEMGYDKLDFNKKDLEIDYSLPQKYQRISLKEMLNAYVK